MLKEIVLLESICRGIDPRDGTQLDTPRDPVLDRARIRYLSLLRRLVKQIEQPNGVDLEKPPMQGKPWLSVDDQMLAARWESDEKKPTAAILAREFGRGEGAILARLAHIGVVPDRESARAANAQRVSAVGSAQTTT